MFIINQYILILNNELITEKIAPHSFIYVSYIFLELNKLV